MAVSHMMAFSWLDDVAEEDRKRLRQDVLDLPHNCKLNGQKYITSIQAGPPDTAGLAHDVCPHIEVFSEESNIFHSSTSTSSNFLPRKTVIISSRTTRYAKSSPLSWTWTYLNCSPPISNTMAGTREVQRDRQIYPHDIFQKATLDRWALWLDT